MLTRIWKHRKISDRQFEGIRQVRCIDTGSSSLCFDTGVGTLTATASPVQSDLPGQEQLRVCVSSDYQKFADHFIPKTFNCYEKQQPRLEATVVELTANPAVDPALFVPPEGAKESVNCLGSIQMPKLISTPSPNLPPKPFQDTLVLMMLTVGITANRRT